jgi:hypothetical protein
MWQACQHCLDERTQVYAYGLSSPQDIMIIKTLMIFWIFARGRLADSFTHSVLCVEDITDMNFLFRS